MPESREHGGPRHYTAAGCTLRDLVARAALPAAPKNLTPNPFPSGKGNRRGSSRSVASYPPHPLSRGKGGTERTSQQNGVLAISRFSYHWVQGSPLPKEA